MTQVFADTFYYLALLSRDDAAHGRAVDLSRTLRVQVITTAWVLTEIADGLSRRNDRPVLVKFINTLRTSANTTIIPPTQELFDRGLTFYSQRLDKDWTLTDCISFVVMEEHGVNRALTGDHHFKQAGFDILFD